MSLKTGSCQSFEETSRNSEEVYFTLTLISFVSTSVALTPVNIRVWIVECCQSCIFPCLLTQGCFVTRSLEIDFFAFGEKHFTCHYFRCFGFIYNKIKAFLNLNILSPK